MSLSAAAMESLSFSCVFFPTPQIFARSTSKTKGCQVVISILLKLFFIVSPGARSVSETIFIKEIQKDAESMDLDESRSSRTRW